MKNVFFTLLILAGLASAQAQGTFQFTVNLTGANEVPPNISTASGSGTFTLNEQSLSYNFGGLWTFPVTTGSINGPSSPGSTAPIIFDLGSPSFAIPNPPDPGGYSFVGSVNNLNSGQINELMAGLWYVNIYSSTYPDGEIRGQIVPVPEPSTLALLGLASGAVLLLAKRSRKKRGRTFRGEEMGS